MSPSPRKCLASACILSLVAAGFGCSRALQHQKADRDVYAAISGKSELLPGEIPLREGGSIEAQPDSRFFNPFDPDHPPMPPDDPVSHEFMLRVDGHRGSKRWNQPGDARAVESESWKALLPWGEDGNVRLDLKTVIQLGLCHSRDFQKEREDLYLSALDVSFERYQLSPKFALTETAHWDAKGKAAAGASAHNRETGTALTDRSVRWLTASGGQLLGDFANSFIWDFRSGSLQSSSSILSLSLVQPLMRLGGRDVVLERLTQSERTLLANVRQMQQFQLGYYVRIAAGRNSGEGPNRSGVVGANGLGIIAGNPASRTGAPAAGGFMGLLEETQRIRNQEANVARLRQSLDQLSAAFDAGRISSRLQVDQARLALFNSQSDLLSAKAGYQARVDAFKVDLGLPPDLPVSIQDTLLNRFSIANPEVTAVDRHLNGILGRARNRDALKSMVDLTGVHSAMAGLLPRFEGLLKGARADLDGLYHQLPERTRQLEELVAVASVAEVGVEPGTLDPKALRQRAQLYARRVEQNADELKRLQERVRGFKDAFEGGELEAARLELADLAADFSGLLLAVSLNQTATRLETATLPPVRMTEEQALAIAKEHRLDWMNARARLVDAWRRVGYTANELQPGVDFTAKGGLGTPGTQPVNFGRQQGFLQAGLKFDTPLSRLAERNHYREALIEYEQARRDFMLFEDKVDQSLRNTLRIIELCQLNFELRRSAVQVALSQVDLARLRLEEPPRPGVAAQFGATTARDLVTALSDLLDAQNNFLSMRVGYEVLRLVLDFESGTMQLDANGLWQDPGPVTADRLAARAPQWTRVARASAAAAPKGESANPRLSFRQAPPVLR